MATCLAQLLASSNWNNFVSLGMIPCKVKSGLHMCLLNQIKYSKLETPSFHLLCHESLWIPGHCASCPSSSFPSLGLVTVISALPSADGHWRGKTEREIKSRLGHWVFSVQLAPWRCFRAASASSVSPPLCHHLLNVSSDKILSTTIQEEFQLPLIIPLSLLPLDCWKKI